MRSARTCLYLCVISLVLFVSNAFGVTASNKNIVIRVLGSWDPFAMGWEPDELLISPTNVLNKPLGAVVDQSDLTNSGGRMLTYFGVTYRNVAEPTNDSTYPIKDDISKGEVTELWWTWDTNYVYFALKGQLKGQANNIILYVDREPGKGKTDFSSGPGWDRQVFFSGVDPDMYIGFWAKDHTPNFDLSQGDGGVHIYSVVVPNDFYMYSPSPTSNLDPNKFYVHYNGTSEPDMYKRVAIGRISWDIFKTNVNYTNMWVKLIAAITGDGFNIETGKYNFDYLPDSSIPVRPSLKTVGDNYILIRMTDGNGNPILGVNVRDNAYVNFYPGIKLEALSSPVFYMQVFNTSTGRQGLENDSPKVFIPFRGDKLRIRIPVTGVENSIIDGRIRIYDMNGNLVKELAKNINFSSDMVNDPRFYPNVSSGVVYKFPHTFEWDGKDDRGNILPTGNYVVIISGKNIGGIDITGTRLVTILN